MRAYPADTTGPEISHSHGSRGGFARARKHPRAAAPGRDPQPSRHRSPEQQRPRGVRSRWPKRGAGAVRAESAGSSVRLPVRGRRRLVQLLKHCDTPALWTRPWSCVHASSVHAPSDVYCCRLIQHPTASITQTNPLRFRNGPDWRMNGPDGRRSGARRPWRVPPAPPVLLGRRRRGPAGTCPG